MLNFTAFDPEYDSKLLEDSYNAIEHKDSLEVIGDTSEKKIIYQKVADSLPFPSKCVFSIQNLLRLTLPNGVFYILQCLYDFGYPYSRVQSSTLKYSFHIIGFADLIIDLGKTLLRPETKTDKMIGEIFGNDIDFEHTETFNDKYYLVSDNKQTIHKAFTTTFVNTLAKYNNLILVTKGKEIFICFENEMQTQHSLAVEDIFSHFDFLIGNTNLT